MQEVRLFEYDVALSFAGEDRSYAESVAEALRARGIRVFYDRYEQAGLWGKDLYVHLDDVYRKKARYCLMFLSKNYAAKVWTSHERRAAQARALNESEEYILPIRLDGTEVEGLQPTISYIDAAEVTAARLAQLVADKLNPPSDVLAPRVGLFVDLDNVVHLDHVFTGYDAAEALLKYSDKLGAVACRWAAVDVTVLARRDVAQVLARAGFSISASEGRSDLVLLERITEETLNRGLDIVVLVTGDGDFYEKIKSLLDLGKAVRLLAPRGRLNGRFSDLLTACRKIQAIGGCSRPDFHIDMVEDVLSETHKTGLNRAGDPLLARVQEATGILAEALAGGKVRGLSEEEAFGLLRELIDLRGRLRKHSGLTHALRDFENTVGWLLDSKGRFDSAEERSEILQELEQRFREVMRQTEATQ